ncbi:hypothetical protein H0H81_006780 [Sphagnurus paluster]|uniref:Uncharacterized protein n=1 Tax=Sphagnurus paluster TaxID=117069 RepID=A0A9P7GME8_9AGAR|nr:hypothetical protein H0H81_006780 [Sphagnurus paluster]
MSSREPRFRSTRARSTLTISPPSTPRSLPPPSPSRSQFNDSPSYRRTLSQAIPYRSPPPSPTIAAPPPPVPPIPSFVLSPPAQIKSTLPKPNRPLPSPITPIRIQDLEDISPLSEFSHITSKFVPASQPPSPEKTKSVGLTCLKFFSLRNSKRGTTHTSRP